MQSTSESSSLQEWIKKRIVRRLPRYYGDPLLETLGEVGIWQISIVIVMTLFNMPSTLQLIAPEVEAIEDGFWCRRPPMHLNMSVAEWKKISGTQRPAEIGGYEYDPCRIKKLNYSLPYYLLKQSTSDEDIPCSAWEYSQEWWTVIAEFNLACSTLPIDTTAESVFSAGAALGCVAFGLMADMYGRRVILLVAQFVQIWAGIITTLVPSFTGYLICKGVQGFVCDALMTCSSVLCVEITGGRWKSIMSIFYMYSYGLGYFTLAALAHIINKWNHLNLIISILSILLFSFWWVIPESPRWLLTKQRLDGVIGVLEAAASINSQPLPSDIVVRLKKMRAMQAEERTKVKLKLLFKTPIMKHLSFVTPFIFFFIFIAYYGLTLRKVTLFSITDKLHVLMIKGGLEMIATTVAILIFYNAGMMLLVIVTLTEGILCLISTLWPSKSTVSMILFSASRFFASVTNTNIAMTVASFYPTIIRMTGLGWGYTCVGLALFVAANVVNLGRISESLPQIIFGISACLGSVLLLLLPKDLSESWDLINQEEEQDFVMESLFSDDIYHSPALLNPEENRTSTSQ